jgi:hypothetical protein
VRGTPYNMGRVLKLLLAKGAKPQPGDAVSADEEIRHPLVLEFLGLRDEYSETDLEDALIRHLETFLLELGNDFAFVGRQHHNAARGQREGGLVVRDRFARFVQQHERIRPAAVRGRVSRFR